MVFLCCGNESPTTTSNVHNDLEKDHSNFWFPCLNEKEKAIKYPSSNSHTMKNVNVQQPRPVLVPKKTINNKVSPLPPITSSTPSTPPPFTILPVDNYNMPVDSYNYTSSTTACQNVNPKTTTTTTTTTKTTSLTSATTTITKSSSSTVSYSSANFVSTSSIQVSASETQHRQNVYNSNHNGNNNNDNNNNNNTNGYGSGNIENYNNSNISNCNNQININTINDNCHRSNSSSKSKNRKTSLTPLNIVQFTPTTFQDYHQLDADYSVSKVLNISQTARVEIALDRKTHSPVILKRLYANEKSLRVVRNEINILKQVKHKNVVEIYEMGYDGEGLASGAENYLVVQEFMQGGDLYEMIVPDVGLSMKSKLRSYTFQICDALQYLHNKGIAHRDVKPENITLNADFSVIKLIDFGLSEVIGGDDKLYKRQVGTIPYMAPELWKSRRSYLQCDLKSIDVWAVGIVIYTCVSGRFPWADASARSVEYLKYQYKTLQEESHWNSFSNKTKMIFKHIFKATPSRRATIEDVKAYISTSWPESDICQEKRSVMTTENQVVILNNSHSNLNNDTSNQYNQYINNSNQFINNSNYGNNDQSNNCYDNDINYNNNDSTVNNSNVKYFSSLCGSSSLPITIEEPISSSEETNRDYYHHHHHHHNHNHNQGDQQQQQQQQQRQLPQYILHQRAFDQSAYKNTSTENCSPLVFSPLPNVDSAFSFEMDVSIQESQR